MPSDISFFLIVVHVSPKIAGGYGGGGGGVNGSGVDGGGADGGAQISGNCVCDPHTENPGLYPVSLAFVVADIDENNQQRRAFPPPI
tara:strand:+ start:358 stop:618 length:261 start_codon:yes stop_codon:yes gene_type:complete